MSIESGGWIHSFAVTETNTHKKGYTLYKITSIVFPKAIPKALTCVSIWKRYHDVKRLYRELKKRHKAMNGVGQVPEPKGENFFKRFDPEIISVRKEYILHLLDFAAQHPVLYKSYAFLQFFEASHTPNNSQLHLNKENNGGNVESQYVNSDIMFEKNGKFAESPQKEYVCVAEEVTIENSKELLDLLDKSKSNDKISEFPGEVDEVVVNNGISTSKNKYLSKLISFELEDMDYIYEAALQFSHAVRAEVNLEYKDAHEKYKNGIERLLEGSKNDNNEERKFIAKAKVAKYMARADEIYEKYILHSDNQKKLSFQLSIDMNDTSSETTDDVYLERPWNQLSRFKVMKIIDSKVLQVQDVTDKSIYIIKGIEKPSCNTRSQSIFLPQNVPYMIELVGFFQSSDKIFLLLQKAKGGKLFDYIHMYTSTIHDEPKKITEIFDEFDEIKIKHQEENISHLNPKFKKLEMEESVSTNENIDDLVDSSQKLLISVNKTLNRFRSPEEVNEQNICNPNIPISYLNSEIQINTSLKTLNFSKTESKLPESCIKQWVRELVTAIDCLHKKGVILGDLHSDNLLLGSHGQLLLSYFYQNEGEDPDSHIFHKPIKEESFCIAPERPLTMKSDWWSLGVVLFKLITGHSYQSCHPGGFYAYFELQFPHVEENELSNDARDLLKGLLQLEPENRFNLEQIKNHKFFENTAWEEIAKNGINSI